MTYDKRKIYHRNALLAELRAEDTEPVFALHRDGKILAFTVNRWQNPEAPAEILVGYGDGREGLAESFIASRPTIPVFIKEHSDTTEWHYCGEFNLTNKTSDETSEKNKRVKPFDIPAIYKILFLEEVR